MTIRRTSRRELLKASLFSIERREFGGSGDKLVTREVVVHPGAVVILPILDNQRIVMIRNFRYTIEEELWELPAGTLEPGEAPQVTASRELIEETGYRAGRIEPMAEFYPSPGVLTEKMHAYIASDLQFVGQRLEESERIQVEIVDKENARRMMIGGELRDAKTIAMLGLYFARGGH